MTAKKRKMSLQVDNTKISSDELPKGFMGDFIVVDEVIDGAEAIILTPAYLMKSKFGMHRIVGVLFGGRRRSLRLNKISLQNLVDAYGEDSQTWVDKKIVLKKEQIMGLTAIVAYPS